jgi:flagellar hook-length control protein FliK
MSFLDHLTKNLNTQTEFFAQLSNISKDSRAKAKVDTSAQKDAPEAKKVELKQDTKVKAEVETKSVEKNLDTNKSATKETEKESDKKDFFATAKEIFREYKNKSEIKDEPKLEDELETVDQALDLIFGLVDPQVIEQQKLQASTEVDLTAALQALEVKGSNEELDPELLDFFLERIDLKISDEIETLTKDIVDLDLNSEDGIKAILEISNSIETLQNVELNIKDIKAKLEAIIKEVSAEVEANHKHIDTTKHADTTEIKPEVEILLETKIETKVKELKAVESQVQVDIKKEVKADTQVKELNLNEAIKLDLKKEVEKPTEIKKVLDEVKASLKQETAIKETGKTPENNYNVKVLAETDIKQETKTTNFTKADVEILEVEEASFSEMEQDSNLEGDDFETLFPREIKASTVKIKTLSKPIPIANLPQVLSQEVETAKTNTKQELRMLLDPQDLGKMQLSITREDNQVHISMVVRTDEAASKLEQKINDIKLALKEKGFESNIEVTKSNSNNSNESQQNQGHTKQDNETRQEQKEKYLNQVPEWISQEAEKISFGDTLNQVL